VLTISGVHAFYGNIEALKGIDLEVRAGEIVTLIGANGVSFSTLRELQRQEPRIVPDTMPITAATNCWAFARYAVTSVASGCSRAIIAFGPEFLGLVDRSPELDWQRTIPAEL
jgi:ABC-type arginine transport system ATPase subunit